jgi:hypothetical protein
MDSRRALRYFWGTDVPGASDRTMSLICPALILMGDWCVSDEEDDTNSKENSGANQVSRRRKQRAEG